MGHSLIGVDEVGKRPLSSPHLIPQTGNVVVGVRGCVIGAHGYDGDAWMILSEVPELGFDVLDVGAVVTCKCDDERATSCEFGDVDRRPVQVGKCDVRKGSAEGGH
jgi:hypothetical protein